jgi:chromate transporter
VFLVASKLGITSFGGPIAHLGYFRREYVERRRWIDEQTYADIVALCSFLPGPTSSETGIAIGLLRAGPLGAVAAWLGFTVPSFILMAGLALFFGRLPFEAGWAFPLLRFVAFGVVAYAVWGMARVHAWDGRRGAIALAAAAIAIVAASAPVQIAVIAIAALVGRLTLPAAVEPAAMHPVPVGRRVAVVACTIFLALLLVLPIVRVASPGVHIALADSFYRSGALVFGGGHVVLPLLHEELVPAGLIAEQRFIAGYGAAQLVPGPLFTFAAYVGAVVDGGAGAVVATIAIFLPGLLLVFAALPSWGAIRAKSWAQSALRGVNAAVVGLLLAALVDIARAIASALI